MNRNIQGDFQICISVPLKIFEIQQNKSSPITHFIFCRHFYDEGIINCEWPNKKFLIILKTCSLFVPQIYQLKMKCEGSSYFYENKKYRSLETEKKNSVISIQKFRIFLISVFSENAQCFVRECMGKIQYRMCHRFYNVTNFQANVSFLYLLKTSKSSRFQMLFKRVVLIKFTNFTGKHL